MLQKQKKVLLIFEQFYNRIEEDNFSRVLSAVYLFDFMDRLRLMEFPGNWLNLLENELKQLSSNFKKFRNYSQDLSAYSKGFRIKNITDIHKKTGEIYSYLWKDFGKIEYYEEPLNLLRERFRKNNISLKDIGRALDAGCGSGRYAFALKALGFTQVIGIDISEESIRLARKMNPYSEAEAVFINSEILDLPFKSGYFDFIFCNGVLHHTINPSRGLKEIYRVLRKNGSCWLFLYGCKGSFFWEVVRFCRRLLEKVPQNYTQGIMEALGYSAGKIFYRTDFFYVPILRQYFEYEVETLLKNAGFRCFRRLKRGVQHDWDEIVYNYPGIDPYIYGQGGMKYFITKT